MAAEAVDVDQDAISDAKKDLQKMKLTDHLELHAFEPLLLTPLLLPAKFWLTLVLRLYVQHNHPSGPILGPGSITSWVCIHRV